MQGARAQLALTAAHHKRRLVCRGQHLRGRVREQKHSMHMGHANACPYT